MRKNFSKPVAIVSALFVTTSCSLFAQKTFDWFVATKNNTRINYVLLIGQNEHTDSIERTRWTRETFDTRDESTEINGNANLGVPKKGSIALPGEGEEIPGKTLDVYEIEHGEQKSLAGIAWDPITANNSMNTWLCKHDTDISIVISNNDCMAEGAMMASNWIKNLPVIGYDANASAIERIADPNNDSLQGTIDQNAASQTAAMGLLVRNILDDLNDKSKPHKIGTIEYNPVYTWKDETHKDGTNDRGFGGESSVTEEKGYYINGFNKPPIPPVPYSDEPKLDGLICPVDNPNNLYLGYSRIEGETDPSSAAHEILSRSFAIDKENVKDYINEDGSAKLPADLAWGRFVERNTKPMISSYRICMTVNSSSDVFLNTTLLPYMQTYAPQLNLNLDTPVMGNGSDEEKMLKEIASRGSKYDAYLINMATTGDGMSFITTIAPQAAAHEGKGKVPKDGWDNFKDRLDTPLIFYNKQPMTSEGNIDYGVMNNKYFKYTYYVGSSASQGGEAQGDLIKKCLNNLYVKAEKEKMR
ncbi:MAG: substrate-binding domain-containing protein [Bacilli bacterium]|nr:substrate-binding domain-containing protein [Bacilli bacterium]